jgi:molecular chaperone DnaK
MVRDAREHEADDKRRRELIEARNQADQLTYSVEKTLRELGDKVPEADKTRIEQLSNDLKAAMPGEDIAQIRSLTEQLQQASYALSQQLYQTQQPDGAAGGPAPNGQQPTANDGDDVVEGEFREV